MQQKDPQTLTPREQLFCEHYLRTADAALSAARAGWRLFPERRGLRLLREGRIRAALERLGKQQPRPEAAAGLIRLAFGSTLDAVRLLLCETPPDEATLSQMDLFGVAELKRPKGGGMEIKFFDRIKALEALAALSPQQGQQGMQDFVNAMHRGAAALQSTVHHEEETP